MFLGSYKTYFSGKNRLVLPKKFRRELGQEESFFVFLGENGEIWGFDRLNFQKQAGLILEIPLSTNQGRKQRLKFFSRADECSLDDQGRFILPQEFMDKVNLRNEVFIIGAGDHFEIWDPKKWQTETANG